MPQTDKISIICNPTAGQRSKPFLNATLKGLQAAGKEVDLQFTEHPGHATSLARQCVVDRKTGLIVAAGGDGTIREVAAGLTGAERPIGIIPLGTANVLARDLGYIVGGRITPARTISVLTGAASTPVYPFTVSCADKSMTGLCWVGAGFDAAVLPSVNPALKARLGRAAFVPAILKTMWRESRNATVPWLLEAGLVTETGMSAWVLVSNIERYAGPFKLTKKTTARQQGLACLFFNQTGGWARALDQLLIALTPLDKRGGTRLITSGHLTLGDGTTPLQLDGDFIGYGPAVIEPQKTALVFKAAF